MVPHTEIVLGKKKMTRVCDWNMQGEKKSRHEKNQPWKYRARTPFVERRDLEEGGRGRKKKIEIAKQSRLTHQQQIFASAAACATIFGHFSRVASPCNKRKSQQNCRKWHNPIFWEKKKKLPNPIPPPSPLPSNTALTRIPLSSQIVLALAHSPFFSHSLLKRKKNNDGEWFSFPSKTLAILSPKPKAQSSKPPNIQAQSPYPWRFELLNPKTQSSKPQNLKAPKLKALNPKAQSSKPKNSRPGKSTPALLTVFAQFLLIHTDTMQRIITIRSATWSPINCDKFEGKPLSEKGDFLFFASPHTKTSIQNLGGGISPLIQST